jgi:hypothetical protein
MSSQDWYINNIDQTQSRETCSEAHESYTLNTFRNNQAASFKITIVQSLDNNNNAPRGATQLRPTNSSLRESRSFKRRSGNAINSDFAHARSTSEGYVTAIEENPLQNVSKSESNHTSDGYDNNDVVCNTHISSAFNHDSEIDLDEPPYEEHLQILTAINNIITVHRGMLVQFTHWCGTVYCFSLVSSFRL